MGKRKDEKNKERIGMKSDEEEKIGLSLYGTSKTRRRKNKVIRPKSLASEFLE